MNTKGLLPIQIHTFVYVICLHIQKYVFVLEIIRYNITEKQKVKDYHSSYAFGGVKSSKTPLNHKLSQTLPKHKPNIMLCRILCTQTMSH